eukprot:8382-Eustigmatos_ZCMA.PRE.1
MARSATRSAPFLYSPTLSSSSISSYLAISSRTRPAEALCSGDTRAPMTREAEASTSMAG